MHMELKMSKRSLLIGAAAVGSAAILGARPAAAQTGGTLDRIRKAGVVKIAVPQTPPWSEIRTDGTLGGIAPEIVQRAMQGLGVTRFEAIPTTYAELIPGMMAGRWDIIGACLTFSKARCAAVKFSSPICFGHLSVAYRPTELKDPPLSLADAAKRGLVIATNAGGYQLPTLRRLTTADKIMLFNDSAAVVEAVVAKRADIAIDSFYGMRPVKAAAALAFTPALTDTGFDKSGPAFRLTDNDLFDAFDAEVRKLKTSGFVGEINKKYGYEWFPDRFNDLHTEAACSTTNI
jgi:polar amino acid transport system substrate-binding protein